MVAAPSRDDPAYEWTFPGATPAIRLSRSRARYQLLVNWAVGPDPEALHCLVGRGVKTTSFAIFSERAATPLVPGGPAPRRRDLCEAKNPEGVPHDGRGSRTPRGRVSVALLTGRRSATWTMTASRSYRVTSSSTEDAARSKWRDGVRRRPLRRSTTRYCGLGRGEL
jgi:hypothetical protein